LVEDISNLLINSFEANRVGQGILAVFGQWRMPTGERRTVLLVISVTGIKASNT